MHSDWDAIFSCITLITIISTTFAAPSCAPLCRCTSISPTTVSVTCNWSHIQAHQPFVAFDNVESIKRLSIECSKNDAVHSTIDETTFAQFTNVEHLTVNKCAVQGGRLNEETFSKMTKLRTVALHEMNDGGSPLEMTTMIFKENQQLENVAITNSLMPEMPSRLFCASPHLKIVNVSGNAIDNVRGVGLGGEVEGDECVNELILLDLSSNQLEVVTVMPPSPSLTILLMTNNRIAHIEKDAFRSTPNIGELHSESNDIRSVDSLPASLHTLRMANNHMETLPNFDGIPLQHVDLSNNHLNDVTNTLECRSLESLDLSNNRLTTIPNIEKCVDLQSVSLQNNAIESIPAGAFGSLSRLGMLSLASNALTAVSASMMNGLTSLTSLDLSHNRIVTIEDGLGLPSLATWHMEGNRLESLPLVIAKMHNLRALSMGDNEIIEVPHFLLDKAAQLRHVNLTRNRLTHVARYVFEDMPQVRVLDLSHNHIETIEANAFSKNANLDSLHLEGNKISSLTNIFDERTRVRAIHVDGNLLKDLDLGALPTTCLSFTADNNSISNLANSRFGESRLEHISLAYNQIIKLDIDVLARSLGSANVSHNHIDTLVEGALPSSLTLLDISHNRLEDLPSNLLMGLSPSSGTLRLILDSNPWLCSCNLIWVQRNTLDGVNVLDAQALQCRHAVHNTTHPLTTMPLPSMLCSYKRVCSPTCVCCNFEHCDCQSICPTGCKCHHDSMLTENVVKCDAQDVNLLSLPQHATNITIVNDDTLTNLPENGFLLRFRLKHLNLKGNAIRTIAPAAFKNLRHLISLDLDGNELEEWRGDELVNAPKLTSLSLGDNTISSLGDESLPSSLKEVHLESNSLTTLPQAVRSFAREATTKAISLGENPWLCDCGARYVMQHWIRETSAVIVRDMNNVYCQYDPNQDNHTSVLSTLSTPENPIVKVDMFTFNGELMTTLCVDSLIDHSAQYHDTSDEGKGGIHPVIPIALVGIALMVTAGICVTLIICRHRSPPTCKSTSSTITTPCSTSLLAYDVFITYSGEDHNAVQEIGSRLEGQSYQVVCLLHKHTPVYAVHRVRDETIQLMNHATVNLLYLTNSFLKHEWHNIQIRTQLACINSKEFNKQMVVIVAPDVDLEKVYLEPPLDQWVKKSFILYRNSPRFWEELWEQLPQEPLGGGYEGTYSTVAYSDAPQPSLLV